MPPVTALQANSGISRTLLDSLTTVVVMLDRFLSIRYVNPAGEQLLEQSARRLVGEPFPGLFEHLSLDLALIKDSIVKGHGFTDSEVTLVLQDGHPLSVDVTATGLRFGDQQYALLEIKVIEQQKRISHEIHQQAQQVAARDLVRGLAHEIKNPLGGLRGAAQLLEKELPSEDLKEFTCVIIEQADRLRNLVDRLLGPQRPGEQNQRNIHMVLERVRQLVSMELTDELQIIRDYDPSIPDFVMDPDQLEQAILNIIKNAVEALSGKGQIRLITRTANQVTLNGERFRLVAEIKIIDNGPGIPKHLQDTLFYPMVTGKSHGTGLGLSIAQTLVNQHKGRIDCASWPGHTEFTIYLPIQK